MNPEYYRKIKGKEPIIINLDSDEEGQGQEEYIS
jgi:hypothetical protein